MMTRKLSIDVTCDGQKTPQSGLSYFSKADVRAAASVVERFLAQLKQFHRIATHYDKLVSRFESFVVIAASALWLK
jgi:transposase